MKVTIELYRQDAGNQRKGILAAFVKQQWARGSRDLLAGRSLTNIESAKRESRKELECRTLYLIDLEIDFNLYPAPLRGFRPAGEANKDDPN